jgi:hypothetical protein
MLSHTVDVLCRSRNQHFLQLQAGSHVVDDATHGSKIPATNVILFPDCQLGFKLARTLPGM